ncbi:MAG: sugar phosphate isomerase/epimerase [Actinobacteria bacterium]|jgi:inosose dehydratase|nr:MAG: sugar phosphate isomerase/epimerase [Actinomycetota bacterium]
MENIKFGLQTNLFGWIQYLKLNDWSEWEREDYSNTFYYLDWDHVLRCIVGAGIKGIDTMFWQVTDFEQKFGPIREFAAFAKERGIEKITGNFYLALGSTDRANHPKILADNQVMIDLTAEMSAPNMCVMPAGQYYGMGPLSQEELQNTADVLAEIGKRALEKGIELSIHTEFFCAINKDELERFMEMIDPRYVCYCLDAAQVAIMGVDPVALYDKYHDRIKYFHLKDTKTPHAPESERYAEGVEFHDTGHRWFWEPGAGEVDYPALWGLLKKHGYKGWITIELDGTPDPLASILLTMWYIDQVLRPIYR